MVLIISAGIGLQVYAALKSYKDESIHLMHYTMSLLDEEYVEEILSSTKEVYESTPLETRKDPFSEEYMSRFRELVDDRFFEARNVLVRCREESENRNIFLMMTDPELSAIIYVVDGDVDEWAYLPGQWIQGNMEEIEKIRNSSWRLRVTHTDDYGWIGTNYEPIEDSSGNRIGYIVMDVDINDFFRRLSGILILLIPLAALLVFFIAAGASRLLKKHILDHLTELADAAHNYTARDKVAELETDNTPSFFGNLNIRTGDELEELWTSMSDMETDITETMRRLKKITAEQEHIEAELSIATRIQEGTLPHTFPAFPDRKEFDIYAYMSPAKEVGGDFYDYFLIDEDHLAMVIADVSGKGISAALFMVNAKAMIQNYAMAGGYQPSEILKNVNDRIIEQNEANMFVTVWLAILTISTGEVAYVNAGHEYPAIRRNGELFRADKDVHGGPVAISDMMRFKPGSFVLQPGETVFVYTDGVTEANNKENELFGMERMLMVLNSEPDADPQTVIQNVENGIAQFVLGEPQFDDTTMLCMKYFGPVENAGASMSNDTDASAKQENGQDAPC